MAAPTSHLVARGAHLAAIRRDGVRVLGPRGDFTAHPPATDDPAEIGPVDIVFLGLKAYQYATAGPLLAPLLAATTAVVAAQNGIPWWYFHGLGGPYDGHRIEAVDPGRRRLRRRSRPSARSAASCTARRRSRRPA